MTTNALDPGSRVFADRGASGGGAKVVTTESVTEVCTLIEVRGAGQTELFVVEFDDGSHETFRAIDGYVRPIPEGWTPERDNWGRFNYHRAQPYPDAAAIKKEHR